VPAGADGGIGRAGERLAVDEARARRVAERHRDHVHEVAERILTGTIEANPQPELLELLLYTIKRLAETPATVSVCEPHGNSFGRARTPTAHATSTPARTDTFMVTSRSVLSPSSGFFPAQVP
jgi:hypothetical protein